MTRPYTWEEVLPEMAGSQEARAPSPWDALSLLGGLPDADRFKIQPDEVDLSVAIGGGEGPPRLELPLVITDNSCGQLSPHARLALIQATHRRGCALRLEDPTPDLIDLARELGVVLWVVLGPDRTEAVVEALEGAAIVELKLTSVGPDGELSSAVDVLDAEGSMAVAVGTVRSVAGGVPIVLNVGPIADRGILRQAARSGADALMVQAASRGSRMHADIVGPGPMAAVASMRRTLSRTKFGKDDKAPKLVVSGGFKDGVELVKALALGADLVVMGTAPRLALGCILCDDCGPGECPKGPHTAATSWKTEADGLVAFVDRMADQARSSLSRMGCERGDQASLSHLEAQTYDVAAVTGAALAGYGEVLPMWHH